MSDRRHDHHGGNVKRSLIVLVAVLLGIAGLAPPARADGEWPGTAVCAEGTLGVHDYVENDIVLAYQVQACAGSPWAGGHWGIARYFDNAATIDELTIHPLPAGGSPVVGTRAGFGYRGPYFAVGGPLRAACVITGRSVRIACVGLTESWNGTVTVSPIPVGDAAVRRIADITAAHEPDPE